MASLSKANSGTDVDRFQGIKRFFRRKLFKNRNKEFRKLQNRTKNVCTILGGFSPALMSIFVPFLAFFILFEQNFGSILGDRHSGIYNVHFNHLHPPPPSFEILFSLTNKLFEFITQKDAFLRPFPPFLCYYFNALFISFFSVHYYILLCVSIRIVYITYRKKV